MPTLGLFGGAAPRIARRIRDQPLQYSDLPPVEEEASAPRGMRGVAGMFGKEMRAPIMASPQGAASPMAETAPSSVPSMGMMMKGPPKPKPQGSGIAEMFGYKGDASGMGALEWWFSPTARRDAAAKGVATQQALEQQRAEVNRQIQTLQEQGYAPDQIIAFMNNPEKWSESLATNLEAANVAGGDSRYVNGKLITADKYGMDGGFGYRQGPGGLEVQGQRPQSYGEQTEQFAADTGRINSAEAGRHNRVSESIDRSRVGADGSTKPPPGFAYNNGKLEFIPGGPADPSYIDVVSDARARGEPEYSQTEQRQYKNKWTALNEFEAGLNDYFRVLEENGGPQTVEGFWNAQQRKNIDAAHALMTLNLKQAYQGGALDKGLIEIAEKILTDPTGWSSFNGGGAAEFKKAAEPIFNNIAYARSQIPEGFRGNATPGGQSGGLQIGHVEDGYRYKGGAPNNPASWEQVR